MESLLKAKNSILWRKVDEPYGDMSEVGIVKQNQDFEIRTYPKKWHDEFKVMDAVFYNTENHEFELAVARNTKQAEVVGLIYSVSETEFQVITSGYMPWPYEFTEEDILRPYGSYMYLSDEIPGKLVFEKPTTVAKRVAVYYKAVIMIDMDVGLYYTDELDKWKESEPYTQEELDDIVSKVWWENKHGI